MDNKEKPVKKEDDKNTPLLDKNDKNDKEKCGTNCCFYLCQCLAALCFGL